MLYVYDSKGEFVPMSIDGTPLDTSRRVATNETTSGSIDLFTVAISGNTIRVQLSTSNFLEKRRLNENPIARELGLPERIVY